MHTDNGESSSSSFNGNVHHNEADLKRTESLSISPELFEKLFLSPQTSVAGDLRSTFGNPTPLAIMGFAVALSPLSIEFMGWRGAGGTTATAGANWFFGGLLLVISGLLEFFLGNTFPSVVFIRTYTIRHCYGAHSTAFAATFQPFFNTIAAFSTEGTLPPKFAASFAFYALFMGLLSVIFLIFSLRTNVIFVIVFIGASLGFLLAAASFWTTALGMTIGATLLKATGGAFFVAAMMG
ncbi:related to Y.lipolytica GPR1 protein and Fun34p [Rhynchosporium graminicola]|uniref:Related to Y.lipolytica GPR1 protein and Fun34p n=1 Tax=Rhynchosporium graminicola TaxID=2792576 RepID=A0A1E1L166_9HELO|nr:related to Y.lipolytica GPR1 protein and Fun34p [Rhynchosporium commune]